MFRSEDHLGLAQLREHFTREVAATRAAITEAVKAARRNQHAFERCRDDVRRIEASNERWRKDIDTVARALPDRGWYLTGAERCTLVHELASLIEANKWDLVDQQMIASANYFIPEKAAQWLSENDVAAYTVARFRLFFHHHQAGGFEEATFVGVPLLDELCRSLYGVDFTTKRSSKGCTKPSLAMQRPSGFAVTSFAKRFVDRFSIFHKDVVTTRLEDPDYFCRHAILHGQMRRPMGPKDSAKCAMAMGFLIFARQEKPLSNTMPDSRDTDE